MQTVLVFVAHATAPRSESVVVVPVYKHAVHGETLTIQHLPPPMAEPLWEKWLQHVEDNEQGIIGFDVETTAIDDVLGPFEPNAKLRLVQFGSRRYAFALDPHDEFWRARIEHLLGVGGLRFCSHTNYDPLWTHREFGTPIDDRFIDTMPMAALLFPGVTMPKGLKDLDARFVGCGLQQAEEALTARFRELAPVGSRVGKTLKAWGFTNIPLDDEVFGLYGGLDAIGVRRLLDVFNAQLRRANMSTLSRREQRIQRLASRMRVKGLRVDLEWTENLIREIEDEYIGAEQRLVDTFGFAAKSPKRGEWLAEHGVEFTEFTPTGQPKLTMPSASSQGTLPGLVERYRTHPVVGPVFADMLVLGLNSNILTNLKIVRTSAANDGYAHPEIKTQAAHTGRMSIVKPAMQTFKKRDPRLRGCFIARDGHVLVSADYDSQEIRIAAAYSRDPLLLTIVRDGLNQHAETAKMIFGERYVDKTSILNPITGQTFYDASKAQPLDAPILTPFGWVPMGSLTPGDYVIGSNGLPTKVLSIHPQGVKETYCVTTSDGAEVECCDEHYWTVRNKNTHNAKWQTRSLRYLLDQGLQQSPNNQDKYELPERPSIVYAPTEALPMSPYVLGLLLGDGCFVHSWAVSFCSNDRELMDAVRDEHERLGGRWASDKEVTPGFWNAYLASGEYGKANKTTSIITSLGLRGHRAEMKFVPPLYLRARPSQRLEVLRGLLDTDGTVHASRTAATFVSVSRQLALDVQTLARSLGGFASIRRDPPANANSMEQWRVHLRLPNDETPFRLERKASKMKLAQQSVKQMIVSAEYVGQKEMQCISVEAVDGLYVADGFVVTHNTLDFAQQYGAGPARIGDQLGYKSRIDSEGRRRAHPKAYELWQAWREAYSGLVEWNEQMAKARNIVNPWGRVIPADRWRPYANANYAIQSTGRDILGDALVNLIDAGWGDYIWLTIHDEVILEVPEEWADAACATLETAMATSLKGVPITATPSITGPRWGVEKE